MSKLSGGNARSRSKRRDSTRRRIQRNDMLRQMDRSSKGAPVKVLHASELPEGHPLRVAWEAMTKKV